jgi:hypothetical protein
MWQLILLKYLHIVQFIESVNAGLQLDWNGVLNYLWIHINIIVYTFQTFLDYIIKCFIDTSRFFIELNK